MKKTFIIIGIIALVMAAAIATIGMISSTPTPQPNIVPPTIPPVVEPTITPLPIDDGTYYYVQGTTTAYNGVIEDLQFQAEYILPKLIVANNQITIMGNGLTSTHDATLKEQNIIFDDNGQSFQEILPIAVEHDEAWHQIYGPYQTLNWNCQYDSSNGSITVKHNSDFISFQLFDTLEEYVRYLTDTFGDDKYFQIYPTPPDAVATQ